MVRMFAAVTFALALPALAVAQTDRKPTLRKVPAKITNPSDGQEMFMSYCAPCHGKGGKGDGPAAVALKNKPADLTQLTRTHGGKFSIKDFEEKVNGLAMTPAHGTSEMPIWGTIFRTMGNDQLRIYNLKKYIDGLQTQ